MRRMLLLVGAVVVAVVLVSGASRSAASGQVSAVQGLMIIEASGRVTIMSPAGKRLPVPARVRESPVRVVAGYSPGCREQR